MKWLSTLFQRVRQATYMIQVYLFFFNYNKEKCQKLYYQKIDNQRANGILFNLRRN